MNSNVISKLVLGILALCVFGFLGWGAIVKVAQWYTTK